MDESSSHLERDARLAQVPLEQREVAVERDGAAVDALCVHRDARDREAAVRKAQHDEEVLHVERELGGAHRQQATAASELLREHLFLMRHVISTSATPIGVQKTPEIVICSATVPVAASTMTGVCVRGPELPSAASGAGGAAE